MRSPRSTSPRSLARRTARDRSRSTARRRCVPVIRVADRPLGRSASMSVRSGTPRHRPFLHSRRTKCRGQRSRHCRYAAQSIGTTETNFRSGSTAAGRHARISGAAGRAHPVCVAIRRSVMAAPLILVQIVQVRVLAAERRPAELLPAVRELSRTSKMQNDPRGSFMPVQTAVVVLAAGAGTRMRSKTPKVLHTLGGRTMLAHSLHAAARGRSGAPRHRRRARHANASAPRSPQSPRRTGPPDRHRRPGRAERHRARRRMRPVRSARRLPRDRAGHRRGRPAARRPTPCTLSSTSTAASRTRRGGHGPDVHRPGRPPATGGSSTAPRR